MRWLIRIAIVLLVLLLALVIFGPGIAADQMNKVEPHEPYKISDRAKALHKTLDLADLHADSLLWGRDLNARSASGHVDVPRLLEGRFALQIFTTVTKTPRTQNYTSNDSETDNISLLVRLGLWPTRTWDSLLERALYQAERLEAMAKASGGKLVFARTRADLEAVLAARAKGESVVAGIMGTEGAHPLEGDLANLKKMHDAGFRMIGLQHFFDNELGGSLHGEKKGGLTPFGVQAVRAIEEMGMVIDVAHSSPAVVDDVLKLATKPIVVSHTGVRGACESPRNLDDARMKAIAAQGGLIGIGFWEGAVCDASPKGVAKSIKYAVDLVGADHVALGSDYDGATRVNFDASESVALIDAMIEAGISDDDIKKIAGGNLLKMMLERMQ